MSAIGIGGRRYAAGLYWLGRGSAGATARTARRLGRPWCVHQADRTGFAGEDPDASPEGLPALALALLDLIRGEFWMALVEGDAETGDRARGSTLESDPGTGDTAADGTGRYALVKARGGTVLADGDEVMRGWVFPSLSSKSGHVEELHGHYARIGKVSGTKFWFHGLRNVFITVAERELMLPRSLTKRLVNHARPSDVTEGYAADWTVEQLREPAQRIADRIDELGAVASRVAA